MAILNESLKGRGRLRIVDFMEASSDARRDFSRRVQRFGEVNILVHPFYHKSTQRGRPAVARFNTARNEFIRFQLVREGPLIIFEEADEVGKLPQRIPNQGTVFVVGTEQNSPVPHKHTWTEVTERLWDGDVRKIGLGGAYLDFESHPDSPVWLSDQTVRNPADALKSIASRLDELDEPHPRWLDNGLVPTHCVGAAGIEMTMQGFAVEFSPVSLAPQSKAS